MVKKRKSRTVKVYDTTYNLLEEVSRMEGRFKTVILEKAMELYKEINFKKRNW